MGQLPRPLFFISQGSYQVFVDFVLLQVGFFLLDTGRLSAARKISGNVPADVNQTPFAYRDISQDGSFCFSITNEIVSFRERDCGKALRGCPVSVLKGGRPCVSIQHLNVGLSSLWSGSGDGFHKSSSFLIREKLPHEFASDDHHPAVFHILE